MTEHIGEGAGAFADGELPPEQMAWAWAHYRACPLCRQIVDDQVAVRTVLRGTTGPHITPEMLRGFNKVSPSTAQVAADPFLKIVSGLEDELDLPDEFRRAVSADSGLSGADQARTVAKLAAVPQVRHHPPRHVPGGSGPSQSIRKRRQFKRRRRLVGLTGTLALVCALAMSAVFMLGNWYTSADAAISGIQILAHVNSAQAGAANESWTKPETVASSDAVLDWMRSNGWSAPATLPHGYYISFFSPMHYQGENFVLLDIATPSGNVWVNAHHARVNGNDLEDVKTSTLGGRTLYWENPGAHGAAPTTGNPQVCMSELSGIWTTGNDVWAFVSDAGCDELAAIIDATPPPKPFTVGVQLQRGWMVIEQRMDWL
ncbi:MAG: hypothetical protein LBM66_02900 [Bifidobacteriaceae bacterium]|jgi:hypothetical protein|nr:hypothetical protein [Bifidobacteriaceae bacterium]